MDGWIDCDDFFGADVIQFDDGIWERKGPKGRQKSIRVGSRKVTAQVVESYVEKGEVWIVIEIIGCDIVADPDSGRTDYELKAGSQHKRLRKSLVKYGNPKRQPWSDESARRLVAADQAAPAARKRRGH